MDKDKAAIDLRRTKKGDFIVEIVGEDGEVLVSRNFGSMTDEEIERVLEVFRGEYSDVVIQPIELTGN